MSGDMTGDMSARTDNQGGTSTAMNKGDPCAGCEHASEQASDQGAASASNYVAVPQPLTFPPVRQVRLTACADWLRLGWADMWRQPLGSVLYGLALVLIGAIILAITAEYPYLYTAAISGFLLVAPMLGAGLYEKSRRYEAGEKVPLLAMPLAWQRNRSALLGFSMLCFLAGTLWQVISVFVLAVFYKGTALKPVEMIIEILRNPEHNLVFAMYLGMGAVFAAVIFALTVVSAPMLVDRRDCRLLTGLGTSINAVADNPAPLAVWATVIMLMVGFGFLTGLLGLIIVLPWLAHASFHAYRALVE